MSLHDDEYEMFIPLSIDHAETTRTNYFLSNRKIVEIVIALIPYMFLMFPLLQGGVRLLQIGIVTGCYAVIMFYFLRYRIFEEVRLRNMLRELDAFKLSGVDTFWGVNKITDNGTIHYVLNPRKGKELGVVVTYDAGSTVGVPRGNFTRYRESKAQFMRELHAQGFDFSWYEVPKQQETPQILIEYFNLMTEIENEEYRKLLKLQIDINNLFVTDVEQPYTDYILIRNANFRTLRRFQRIVQDCIDSSLSQNSYIRNARILNKHEVEKFIGDYLVLEMIDSAKVRRGVQVKPFEQFAKVTRIVKHDGTELPMEFIERFDLQAEPEYSSVENILDREDKKVQTQLKILEKRKALEMDKLKKERLKEKITHVEYTAKLKELDEQYAQKQADVLNPPAKPETIPKPKTKPKEKAAPPPRAEETVEVKNPLLVTMQQQMAAKLAAAQVKERGAAQQPKESELSLEELLEREQRGKGERP